jgi:hypothetical protein
LAVVSADRFASGADEKFVRTYDAPQTAVDLLSQFAAYEDDSEPAGRAARAYLPALGLTVKGGEEGGEEEVSAREREGGNLRRRERASEGLSGGDPLNPPCGWRGRTKARSYQG